MGFVDGIKDALLSGPDPCVIYRCTDCGLASDEPRERCPDCGSSEFEEEDGLQVKPNA